MTATQTTRHRALYVGGPPGQTFIKIRRRLGSVGIEVVEQTYRVPERAPRWATAILVNIDMCDHPMFIKARELARDNRLAFGSIHLGWSHTMESLKASGFEVDPVVHAVIENDNEEEQEETNMVTAEKEKRPMTPTELAALLEELAGDEKMQETIVQSARAIARRRAVSLAVDAVEALDEDGLVDLASALSQKRRASLRAACDATMP